MNIVILSRNKNLYSTRRLVEEAEDRGHDVQVIDPLNCDLIIEKEKPFLLIGSPPCRAFSVLFQSNISRMSPEQVSKVLIASVV